MKIERWLRPQTARWALLLVVLVCLPALWSLQHARLDHDFEKFFPMDDPELDRYLAYRDRFGNDNDFLMIGLEHLPSVYDAGFLARVDGLCAALDTLEDVAAVISPTRFEDPIVTPVGVFRLPMLRIEHDSLLQLDAQRLERDPRIMGTFISQDAEAILVFVETASAISKKRSDALLMSVEDQLAHWSFADARMAGRIHGQFYYIQKMEKELVTFFTASVLLLALFLAIAFRTLWGVAIPIIVVALAVLWQVGLMTLLGQPLSIMTMLLPTILFVVGMSDAVHIIERYIESLRNGHSKVEALSVTYREVGSATFLTSLTTAVGFLTLTTSSILPIREFGIYTAIGVAIAYVLAFTVLPSILLLVRTPVLARKPPREDLWERLLDRCFGWVIRNPRTIIGLFSIGLVAAALLIANIKVDNTLLEDWPSDDPHKMDFFFFEDHFGGVRPFEMEITLKDSAASIWDLEVLRHIEMVQYYLDTAYNIQHIVSPVTVMYSMNRAFNGGSWDHYSLPEDQGTVDRYVRRIGQFSGEISRDLVSDDGLHARLSGRMQDEGGYAHAERNAAMAAFIAMHTDLDLLAFDQTGMAFLIDRNNSKLSRQMLLGLSIAFLLVALIMAWNFKRWNMVWVALIPNIVPLVFIAGFMGAAGIDLKVSTAIIFTIAFGIAVDDSIHLLGKLRIELAKGRSLPMALRRSYLSAGKAVLVTSLMLVSGFISLVFSDFASVFYMGLLVSLTLVMALLADLFLLPVLVLLALPRRSGK